jgi:formylglycine-generating enzyme
MRLPSSLVVLSLAACGSPSQAVAPPAPASSATPTPAVTAVSAAPAATATVSAAPVASAAPAAPVLAAPAPPPSRCPDGTTLVPGGEFKPPWNPKSVSVPDLCVDTTETTAKAYGECVAAGACTTKQVDCAAQSTYGKAETEDYPMVCVDASQANAYCAFRKKRLPTTGEWEWAARGGAEGRPFPWGEAPPKDQLCWAGVEKQSMSCKVGSYPAGDSAQGIKDMSGNVLEFTTTDNDARSDVRIARGGSWRDGTTALVKNSRLGGFGVTYRCAFLGIRCVHEPSPTP